MGGPTKQLKTIKLHLGCGEKHTDDFSQSYLPHMDKKNGKLMSLNIEAVK